MLLNATIHHSNTRSGEVYLEVKDRRKRSDERETDRICDSEVERQLQDKELNKVTRNMITVNDDKTHQHGINIVTPIATITPGTRTCSGGSTS